MIKKLVSKIFAIAAISSVSVFANAQVLVDNYGEDVSRGNSEYTLTFSNLGMHSYVLLDFDLYIFGSWDGLNTSPVGQDFFGFRIDENPDYEWSFSYNYNTFMNDRSQGVNYNFTTGNFNDDESWNNRDQYFSDFYNGFLLPHSSEDLAITFFGRGLQGLNDESWNVNDIKVETIDSVFFEGNDSYLLADVGAPLALGLLFLLSAPIIRRKEA